MQYRLRTLLQFSLRALLVVTAVCCTGAAVYGWRQRREEQMVRLVERFNREMDKNDFDAALLTAEDATRQFPAERVSEFMLEKVRWIRSYSRGDNPPAMIQLD